MKHAYDLGACLVLRTIRGHSLCPKFIKLGKRDSDLPKYLLKDPMEGRASLPRRNFYENIDFEGWACGTYSYTKYGTSGRSFG